MPAQRRIVDDSLHAHFVAFSVYCRRRLLDHDQLKRIGLGVLNDLLEKTDSRCVGFELMPNQVDAVLWFSQPGLLSHIMHQNPVREGLVGRTVDNTPAVEIDALTSSTQVSRVCQHPEFDARGSGCRLTKKESNSPV